MGVVNEIDRITFTGADAKGFYNAYNSYLTTGFGQFEITGDIYDFDIAGLDIDAYKQTGGGYRMESSFVQKIQNQV